MEMFWKKLLPSWEKSNSGEGACWIGRDIFGIGHWKLEWVEPIVCARSGSTRPHMRWHSFPHKYLAVIPSYDCYAVVVLRHRGSSWSQCRVTQIKLRAGCCPPQQGDVACEFNSPAHSPEWWLVSTRSSLLFSQSRELIHRSILKKSVSRQLGCGMCLSDLAESGCCNNESARWISADQNSIVYPIPKKSISIVQLDNSLISQEFWFAPPSPLAVVQHAHSRDEHNRNLKPV